MLNLLNSSPFHDLSYTEDTYLVQLLQPYKQVKIEDESRNKTKAVSTQNRLLCEQFNTKSPFIYATR